MSSWRNAIRRREHRERRQPRARKKFGLLEKKKDYIERARNFQQKQTYIKSLRVKATERNPDEFYSAMITSRLRSGKHIELRDGPSADMIKLLKGKDRAYVGMKLAIERKKTEKLASELSFVSERAVNKHTIFLDSDDDEDSGSGSDSDSAPSLMARAAAARKEEEDDDTDGSDAEAPPAGSKKRSPSDDGPRKRKRKRRRARPADFDPADYFDTEPELVHRAFNRLRKSQLADGKLLPSSADAKEVAKSLRAERKESYRLLSARRRRVKQLQYAKERMDLERAMTQPGRKKKVAEASGDRPARFVFADSRSH